MEHVNRKLKWFLYFNIALIAVIVCYKVYINFLKPDFDTTHTTKAQDIRSIINKDKANYSFAVVGSINNSIGIFESEFIPNLNLSDIDFVISTGDAVSNGSEDKYQSLKGMLSKLNKPYLLTFSDNEYSQFGSYRFYDHFGPYYFSLSSQNELFIFLDSTGKTDFNWQLNWLKNTLKQNTNKRTFIFSGHGLIPATENRAWLTEEDYRLTEVQRNSLLATIAPYDVKFIFSTGIPGYTEKQAFGFKNIITGGAGGFISNGDKDFYHYIRVNVKGDKVESKLVPIDIEQTTLSRMFEGAWMFIYSLFYVSYLNFILILTVLISIGIWLYGKVFVNRDYYPNFDVDTSSYDNTPLNVAMFTNNYLPFIGGVPISIQRLITGLKHMGHKISLFAPAYDNSQNDEDYIVRIPKMLPFNSKSDFKVANIFWPPLYKKMWALKPDIIHVHHPFWLGSAGLWLGRRLRIPVIYTYHTRLEQYAHFVPLPGPLFRNLVSHSLVKRFANKCDGIVVPTESAEEYLRMIGVRKPTLVQPTGINTKQVTLTQDQKSALVGPLNLAANCKILITIARLSKEKNLDFMLDGIKLLKQRSSEDFRLLILGDGPERAHLQQRIDQENLTEHVTLLGAVPPEKVAQYCQLADLFIFTSRSETQGMVILEAMAENLPVVTVKSSGINDIVKDDVNGFKTSAKTSAWSDAILRVLENQDTRNRLAKGARETALAHNIDAFSESIADFYIEVLCQKKVSAS
ncbi:glycosyltransferase [Bermanella sp. R86510]|uniref:glycosyltransferase n=1 Tax=unclassified Bermanella TaxID=2627862 RepID=UPI0037C878E9